MSATVAAAMLAAALAAHATPRKSHTVYLAAVKRVPYSKAGDPAGAAPGETELAIRALVVDGQTKEWTTGDKHDVTDRSFVIRRATRLNDALPGDASTAAKDHWVWQRGPWLLVSRATGRITALKLPDYDPGVSQVVWFRDYGAYCGITPSGKSLHAVVAQIGVRKLALSRKLAAFDAENPPVSVCGPVEWQREPLRVTFHPTGHDAVSFDLAPGSAALVEDSEDEPDTTPPDKPN
ncbi:MAG TPA: hypothetical protein VG893_05715 [Terracidiphilus sp.]|nr:hypothetical protein [Terracidiphilus sp.]